MDKDYVLPDGMYVMSKDEFVERFLEEQAKRKAIKDIQENKKTTGGKKPTATANKKPTENKKPVDTEKKDTSNKKTDNKKQTTSTNLDGKDLIMAKIYEIFGNKAELTVSLDSNVITIVQKGDTFELKCTKKKDPYEIEDYNGTKDAVKNKFIKYIIDEFESQKYTKQPIDKSGTIGFDDNSEYFTVKITKKRG